MKVVINRDWGGFSVSKAVYDELGWKWDGYGYPSNEDFGIKSDNYDEYRAHPDLIRAIEKVGVKKANGKLSCIEIVEIPDGIDWYIHDYDGRESIHENHRSW